MTAAVVATGLTKRYRLGRPPALDGIDLEIAPGRITALVGPNGAGKSTLIRCCLGFERPTRGWVTVDGIDPRRDRARALSRIGYVGQEMALYRQLTADQHLAHAADLRHGFDRAGAAARLDANDVPRGVRVAELSGGQQAQVALAIALGTRAPVLLLDEPIARLDPLARREFLATLHEAVRTEGSTVLMASHIVGDLEDVAERLVVLAPAAVMFHGTVREARTNHAVIPATSDVAGEDVVATFSTAGGRRQLMVRRAGTGGAGLDDVVLGYLAAANAARRAAR